MQARSPSTEKKARLENYKARYTGDLPKFLGTSIQAILLWFAARFPFLTDKAAASNKNHPSVDNADNFMVQASGIIAGLFGYVIGNQLINHKWVEPENDAPDENKEGGDESENRKDLKKKYVLPLNPSYRIYKTLSVIFQALGSIFLIPVIFVDKVSQRLEMGFSAALIGSLSAIAAPVVLKFKKPFMQWLNKYYKDEEELNDLFKVAQDGWSKYMRTALYWGMCVGGIFGPLFLGLGGFNNLNTAVTYSGALGGLACCALAFVGVPLLNFISKRVLKRDFVFSYDSKELKDKPDEEKARITFERRNSYHDNYARVGMSIFLAFGATFASVWGLMHGYPVDELLGFAAWGGAVGGAIGGVIFVRLGKEITDRVKRPKTRNPWDFILNNTGTLFSYLGTAIGVVASLILFPGDSLSAMALGTCLGKAGGTLVGVAVGCKWTFAAEEYKPLDGSYWTQRMLLAANKYGILGAFTGACTGIGIYFVYPMLCACPGLNFFTILGASVTLGTSTFSFIAGAANAYNGSPKGGAELEVIRTPGMGVNGIHGKLPGSRGPSCSQSHVMPGARYPRAAVNGNGVVHGLMVTSANGHDHPVSKPDSDGVGLSTLTFSSSA